MVTKRKGTATSKIFFCEKIAVVNSEKLRARYLTAQRKCVREAVGQIELSTVSICKILIILYVD